MPGRAGPPPSTEEICQAVSREQIYQKVKLIEQTSLTELLHFQTEKLSKTVKTVEDLVVWKTRNQTGSLVKGEKCPISGFWFWESIAKCGCQGREKEDEEDDEYDEESDYDDDDNDYDDDYDDDYGEYEDDSNYDDEEYEEEYESDDNDLIF